MKTGGKLGDRDWGMFIYDEREVGGERIGVSIERQICE